MRSFSDYLAEHSAIKGYSGPRLNDNWHEWDDADIILRMSPLLRACHVFATILIDKAVLDANPPMSESAVVAFAEHAGRRSIEWIGEILGGSYKVEVLDDPDRGKVLDVVRVLPARNPSAS